MWEDPIVAEVHRTRERLAAKYNFDIKAYFADMRQRQAALGDRLVLQQKRADPGTVADNGENGSPASTSEQRPRQVS